MKTVRLKEFTNNEFETGAGFVKRALWFICNVIFIHNKLNPFMWLKRIVLIAFGAKIGSGLVLKPGVNIKFPWKLRIADNVWIGENVWIDNLAKVVIESNVCISQGAYLLTGNHNYKKQSFDLITKPIVLKEGVWIGAKSTVCPGVTVHKNSILTVGSIATKTLEAGGVYQGNPATKIKDRVVE